MADLLGKTSFKQIEVRALLLILAVFFAGLLFLSEKETEALKTDVSDLESTVHNYRTVADSISNLNKELTDSITANQALEEAVESNIKTLKTNYETKANTVLSLPADSQLVYFSEYIDRWERHSSNSAN